MWTEAVTVFQKYMGTGLVVIGFLAALSYVFLNEKQKPRRILFVYMPVMILLLFFNPVFAGIFFAKVGSEIYFRIWWLIPVIQVIAYAVVSVCERLQGRGKALFAVTSVVLIVISGKSVYTNPLYSRAENCYHVPDCVVELCDAIVVPGREVMAAFPRELLLYVRQYEPGVCMPYGRDQMGKYFSGFLTAMEQEEPDAEEIAAYADQTGCHYVILSEEKKLPEDARKLGLELYAEKAGYVIYRNTNVPLEIPQTD